MRKFLVTVILALFLSGNAVAGITDLIDKIKDFSNKEDSTEKKLAEERLAKEKKLAEEKLAKEKKLAETINLLCKTDILEYPFQNFIFNTKSKEVTLNAKNWDSAKFSYYIENNIFIFYMDTTEGQIFVKINRMSGTSIYHFYDISENQKSYYFEKMYASYNKLIDAADDKLIADQEKLDLDYNEVFFIDDDVKRNTKYDEYMKKSDELDKIYYEFIEKITDSSYETRFYVKYYNEIELKPTEVSYGKCEKTKNKF